ncbi:MAG: hypothetical protein P8P17_05160, partial [Pseudomonadales bacterium]|nr:hypothetical protein [Pseudomonadales bacterium]
MPSFPARLLGVAALQMMVNKHDVLLCIAAAACPFDRFTCTCGTLVAILPTELKITRFFIRGALVTRSTHAFHKIRRRSRQG